MPDTLRGGYITRDVFPLSKTCWALIGVLKILSRLKEGLQKAGLPE
jgi:hypothetical protein